MTPNTERPDYGELMPCPFCGGHAYYNRAVNGTAMHKVGCSQCGIEFKALEVHYPDPQNDHLTKDIVAAWNRRSPDPARQIRELVEIAKEIVALRDSYDDLTDEEEALWIADALAIGHRAEAALAPFAKGE